MKEIEKEYLNQELKKLKAKRDFIYAGVMCAAYAAGSVIPIGLAYGLDINPFDKNAHYDVGETTITVDHLDTGGCKRMVFSNIYSKADKIFNNVPDDYIKLYLFSKEY
ncbi:MAG: hypothetical protein J5892_03970 [Bacilli bacterium]|nr:hypothetical protein [Bacilli bacterium]